MTTREIVTDKEIENAWHGCWEANVNKRQVIFDTLWKYAGNFSAGNTATRICSDLSLLNGYRRNGSVYLSTKGRRYFWHAIDEMKSNSLSEINKAHDVVKALEETLIKAKQFIINGIEFGYIQLPDCKIDAAKELPAAIEKSLAISKAMKGAV